MTTPQEKTPLFRFRSGTLGLLALTAVLTTAALIVGFSDNPPGIALLYAAGVTLVLAGTHHWRSPRRFGLLLIGYENRLLAAEDFEDDTKDAGELGAGHSVTALYEVIPAGVDSPVKVGGVDSLRYQTVTPRRNANDSPELLFVKLRYKNPDQGDSRLLDLPVLDHAGPASQDFQFASAVAAWGMLLRDSEFCEGFTLDQVVNLARKGLGEDTEGYRSEFIRLVETTKTLDLLEREPGATR
jgi:hypothetical protein